MSGEPEGTCSCTHKRTVAGNRCTDCGGKVELKVVRWGDLTPEERAALPVHTIVRTNRDVDAPRGPDGRLLRPPDPPDRRVKGPDGRWRLVLSYPVTRWCSDADIPDHFQVLPAPRTVTASEARHLREEWGTLPPLPSDTVRYEPAVEEAVRRLHHAWATLEKADKELDALARAEGYDPKAYRRCSECGSFTQLACSDCALDGKGTVYVCRETACRDDHGRSCSGHASEGAREEPPTA